MFRKERETFVNLYKREPKYQENIYYTNEYKNEKVNCNSDNFYTLNAERVSGQSTKYCDETSLITNIDEFFDNGWFDKYNTEINNTTNYKKVKDLIIEFKRFKTILKI